MTIERAARRPVALITGASHGIGRAVGTALFRSRYSLVLCARNEVDLASVREELLSENADGEVITVPTNLSVAGSRNKLVSGISETFGYLTAVIHCASARPDPDLDSRLATTSEKTIDELVSTNLAGMFHLTKQLQSLLRAGQPSK